MSRPTLKHLLFLSSGNGDGGRLAAAVFGAAAAKMGLSWKASAHLLSEIMSADVDSADFIVALQEAEHRPLLEQRFPDRVDRVEYWRVVDAVGAEPLIEREVMDLLARLLGGGRKREESNSPALPAKPGKKPVVRVGRETKGRRGKGVTTVFDLPLDEAGVRELAATLKQRCGTGGTVKEGCIEIQGDQRERLIGELERLGFTVKRAGG